MSTSQKPFPSSSGTAGGGQDRSYFEQQRAILLQEIGVSFEHVLANINKLNRSLEGVIAVGNEFSSVEALWSTFEGVMGVDASAEAGKKEDEAGEGEDDGEEVGEEGGGGEGEESYDEEGESRVSEEASGEFEDGREEEETTIVQDGRGFRR